MFVWHRKEKLDVLLDYGSNELQNWVGESIDGLRESVASDWIDGEQLNRQWNSFLEKGTTAPQHLWKWINLHIMLNKVV